ncbi:MAG TPA: transcriptional regulator, partial [Pyrinomonadaceae bacterium]
MPLPRFYEFAPFRVDTVERMLLRDGAAVPLTQKSFDVLLALIERSGRLVGKEELIRKVWPEQFVDEGNLTQHIYTLRRTLGGAVGGEQYIETVPRRGYRFLPRVEAKPGGAASAVGGAGAPTEAAAEKGRAPEPEPAPQPETNYTRSGEVNIAYQVIGD